MGLINAIGLAIPITNNRFGGGSTWNPSGFDPNNPPAGIYVKTTGNDSTGDGSYDNPYATLHTGLLNSLSGDTVWLEQGHYVESVPTGSYLKFRAGVTVRGYGFTRPHITLNSTTASTEIWGDPGTQQVCDNIIFEINKTYSSTAHYVLGNYSSFMFVNCAFIFQSLGGVGNWVYCFGTNDASNYKYAPELQNCIIYTKHNSEKMVAFQGKTLHPPYTFKNNIWMGQVDYFSGSGDTHDYSLRDRYVVSTGLAGDSFWLPAGHVLNSTTIYYYLFYLGASGIDFGDGTTYYRAKYKGSGTFDGGSTGKLITFSDSPNYANDEIESMTTGSGLTADWGGNTSQGQFVYAGDGGHNTTGLILDTSQGDPYPDFDSWLNAEFPTPVSAIHAGDPTILNPDGSRSHIGIWGGPKAWV